MIGKGVGGGWAAKDILITPFSRGLNGIRFHAGFHPLFMPRLFLRAMSECDSEMGKGREAEVT